MVVFLFKYSCVIMILILIDFVCHAHIYRYGKTKQKNRDSGYPPSTRTYRFRNDKTKKEYQSSGTQGIKRTTDK